MSVVSFSRGGKHYEFSTSGAPKDRLESLLRLHHNLGSLTSWATYVGEDPFKEWNDKVHQAQEVVWEAIRAHEEKRHPQPPSTHPSEEPQ